MKYYAVRSGRSPGIYTEWNMCEKQVKGFARAVYKSFSTKEDAEAFLNATAGDDKKHTDINPEIPYAYVDGSYNQATGIYGCGGFLYENGKYHIITASGSGPEKSMRNVAGEIMGACRAIKLAYSLGLRKIQICYDYLGIEQWASGAWKTKNEWSKDYYEFIQKYSKLGMKLIFIHTKGHTGIAGNEFADHLAKQAVGIIDLKNLDCIKQLMEKSKMSELGLYIESAP